MVPEWSAAFRGITPFRTESEAADISAVQSAPGVLSTAVVATKPRIVPQTIEYFFDPELTEPATLTNGTPIPGFQLTYPSSRARSGTIRVTGYRDGGLIDDEIMVGTADVLWEGGVTLDELTSTVVGTAVLLSGEQWVDLNNNRVSILG